MRLRLLAVGTVPALLLACAEARAPSGETPPRPRAELPDGVHWMRNSAEHRALYRQAYTVAEARLPELTAALGSGRWAVALDADETVLDNSPYQKSLAERGERFSQQTWHEWCRRRDAQALPGAARFLHAVRRMGGLIAIVTNRSEVVCEDTEANLRAQELPFDVVLCRPEESAGEKAPRWERIEAGTAAPDLPPARIVMWVGDNILDFPGLTQTDRSGHHEAFADFGRRFIIVPNPVYGSWERNPRD